MNVGRKDINILKTFQTLLFRNIDPIYPPIRSLESVCYLIPTNTLTELCLFDRQSGVFIVARLHYFGCYWSWTVLLFSIYRAVCSGPLPAWTLCYPFFSHWYVIFLYRLTFICHLSTFPICHWHFGSVPIVFYASHLFDWWCQNILMFSNP